MNYGFTNDDEVFKEIQAWRDAAIADGWTHKPLYEGEAEDRACELEKDGWKVLIYTRTNIGKWKYEAQVNVWGPDRLSVSPGQFYSWEGLLKKARQCHFCLKEDVDISRVGFANRACAACMAKAKNKLEFPGWCD